MTMKMMNMKMKRSIFVVLMMFLLLGIIPPQANAQSDHNGLNITIVNYSTGGNNLSQIKKADYKNITNKAWKWSALDQRGSPTGTEITCNETRRDQWSVYLSCPGSNIQIDLNKKTVSQTSNGTTTVLGPVTYFKDQVRLDEETADDVEASKSIRRPLSEADLKKVMMWIAKETALSRTPYCYRKRYPNTAGTPMTCQAGYDQETLGLCSKKCPSGSKGIASNCYKNCPTGFSDDGLYCGKQKSYTRGAGYPWKPGDPPGQTLPAMARCLGNNSQGCEQKGLIWYPKCKAGFKAGVTECTQVCPNGFTDIGGSCKKPNFVRATVPVNKCPSGKTKSGALCYPNCRTGFKAEGLECLQKCSNSRNKEECGVGCADNESTCVQATADMVLAPINFITSVLSLGLEAKIASQVAKRAAAIQAQTTGLTSKHATEIAENALKLEQLGPKMFKVSQTLVKFEFLIDDVGGFVDGVSSQVQNNSEQHEAYVEEMNNALDTYAEEYADSFESSTSFEINQKINAEFGGSRSAAAIYIKRVWAKQQLVAILQTEKWRVTKQILDNASDSFDFLGLKDVANAFAKPGCEEANFNPFPKVNKLY